MNFEFFKEERKINFYKVGSDLIIIFGDWLSIYIYLFLTFFTTPLKFVMTGKTMPLIMSKKQRNLNRKDVKQWKKEKVK